MIKRNFNQYVVVKNSNVHGKGIFAKKDICKGTEIIEYVGKKITKRQAEETFKKSLEEHKKDKNKGAVYIFELNSKYDIDGDVPYNMAKYINHSCEPNCEAVNINGHIWIVALKNIKKGEELSYDYGYSLDDYHEHPCLCGAKNCVGFIVSEEYRKKVVR